MRKRPNRPIDNELFNTVPKEEFDAGTLDTPERVLAYCQIHGLIDGNTTNIEGLIQNTPNLDLAFEDIGEFDAYIEKTNNKTFRIVINKKHSKTRQAFSMAHEYAHYQLHRKKIETMPKGERILHRGDKKNPTEFDANRFGAETLMPENTFKQLARALHGDVFRIAEEFAVSTLAVRFRARDLGIEGHGL